MKNFIILFLFSLLSMASVQAQSLILRNAEGKFGKTLRTTDSTFRSIDSAFINLSEAGIIEAKVIGLDTAGALGVTGVVYIRYVRAANGTITLGTPQAVLPITTDASLSPATFRFSASGNKIYLDVKGKLNTSVHWYSTIIRRSVFKR